MYQVARRQNDYAYLPPYIDTKDQVVCDWKALRDQLLLQWERITPTEIDSAGPHRSRLARLVSRKYGVNPMSVENYLRNFERTMPL